MGQMKTSLTVKEAALVVSRNVDTIYEWIEKGKLTAERNAEGILEVTTSALLHTENTTRRGRPRKQTAA